MSSTPSPTRVEPVALLGGLYSVQGMVFGFTSLVLVPWLAARGVSLDAQTGLVALASLPWVLKLPIAFALDRVARPAGQVAGLSTIGVGAVLATLAPWGEALAQAWGLGIAWFGLNVFLAAQDVSADALAIDAVSPNRRGQANSIMWMGQHVGSTLLGAMGLGALLTQVGVAASLAVLAAVVVACGVWALRDRSAVMLNTSRTALVAVLRAPQTWLLGGLASVFLVADVVTGSLGGAFLIQRLGWSLEHATSSIPLISLIANVVGFGIAAVVIDRIGHGRAASLGSVCLGLVWACFAGVEPAWDRVELIYGLVVVQAFATAMMYGGLYAWMMDGVIPRFRATHFAVLMSLLNVPRAWGPPLAPKLLDGLGWVGLFAFAGVVQVAMGGLAWALDRWTRSRVAEPAGSLPGPRIPSRKL